MPILSLMAIRAPETDGRRKAAAARRRAREAEIIAATRELFDQRGVSARRRSRTSPAPWGSTGRSSTGTSRGKEELFALTLVGYLDELRADMLATAADREREPRATARRRSSVRSSTTASTTRRSSTAPSH